MVVVDEPLRHWNATPAHRRIAEAVIGVVDVSRPTTRHRRDLPGGISIAYANKHRGLHSICVCKAEFSANDLQLQDP
jgi:hypothetical protein